MVIFHRTHCTDLYCEILHRFFREFRVCWMCVYVDNMAQNFRGCYCGHISERVVAGLIGVLFSQSKSSSVMNLAFRTRSAIFSRTIKMSSRQLHSLDTSPPVHREMTQTLQRDAFKKSLTVLAASVPPEQAGLILTAEPLRGSVLLV